MMGDIRLYKIMMEGDPPIYLGCAEASSFQEACKRFFRKKEQYDEVNNTYWGKQLLEKKKCETNPIFS